MEEPDAHGLWQEPQLVHAFYRLVRIAHRPDGVTAGDVDGNPGPGISKAVCQIQCVVDVCQNDDAYVHGPRLSLIYACYIGIYSVAYHLLPSIERLFVFC